MRPLESMRSTWDRGAWTYYSCCCKRPAMAYKFKLRVILLLSGLLVTIMLLELVQFDGLSESVIARFGKSKDLIWS